MDIDAAERSLADLVNDPLIGPPQERLGREWAGAIRLSLIPVFRPRLGIAEAGS